VQTFPPYLFVYPIICLSLGSFENLVFTEHSRDCTGPASCGMSLQRLRIPGLTIFGRSLLLISLEVCSNALFWIMAGILFGRNDDTRPILNLALLAWVRPKSPCVLTVAQRNPQTLGLRHGARITRSCSPSPTSKSFLSAGRRPYKVRDAATVARYA
jgi:hypothetical protein